MKSKKNSKGQVLLYKNRVEVRLDKETVWLSLNQMADLFGRDKSVISRHLRNVFKNKELKKVSVVANFATTAVDGKTYQVEYYNLDAIISIGYWVNSVWGTQFRIWATNVLRKHLIDGYTLNEKRLKVSEHKFQELKKSFKLLTNIIGFENLSDDAKGLIRVISGYTRALDVLDEYDHQELSIPKGTKREKFRLTYTEARKIIDVIRTNFKASGLVGQEKDQSFKSSINAIYQTSGGKDVYPTVEEKAVHLLYFVTKNHSFVDGNKRIAAALFICFLQKNGILLHKDGSRRIDDSALVALTLMVAASKSSEKEIMIKVMLNLMV